VGEENLHRASGRCSCPGSVARTCYSNMSLRNRPLSFVCLTPPPSAVRSFLLASSCRDNCGIHCQNTLATPRLRAE
jgi:hypothetical protein